MKGVILPKEKKGDKIVEDEKSNKSRCLVLGIKVLQWMVVFVDVFIRLEGSVRRLKVNEYSHPKHGTSVVGLPLETLWNITLWDLYYPGRFETRIIIGKGHFNSQ